MRFLVGGETHIEYLDFLCGLIHPPTQIFQVSGGAYAVTLANTGVLNNVVLNFPYDDQNNPPAIGAGGFITWADVVPGEPIDVYIEITYTPTPTGWTGGSSINGVALADLGSMNGISFTDIASINGI